MQNRGSGRKPVGIAPKLLFDQVKNTAPWSLTLEPPLASVEILKKAPELEQRWRKGQDAEGYFVALLAAHFTTVATFVPTDVDQRIRQHAWSELSGKRLASAVDRVEEVARWDVRPVSERYVTLDGEVLAGHQGEWLSVMAGALGRALALSDAAITERATAFIEAELAREARLVTLARKEGNDRELLTLVTTVAHNLGDLSRVVDTWRPAHAASELGLRYQRLGHEGGARFDGAFVFAGELNKLPHGEGEPPLPAAARAARAAPRARLLAPVRPVLLRLGARHRQLEAARRRRARGDLARPPPRARAAHRRARLPARDRRHPQRVPGRRRQARAAAARRARRRHARAPACRVALRLAEKDFVKKFHAAVER